MTLVMERSADGVARHSGADARGRVSPVEGFRVYAAPEIAAHPFWQRGVCFNAGCGRGFEVRRDWQMFCSEACERAFTTEARAWGHRMALPLLVHRFGKYETRDEGLRDLTRAARRYVAHAQSAWLEDRAQRSQAAGRG